jgi:hypothetical protein
MKGTYIKVINEVVFEEIKKLEIAKNFRIIKQKLFGFSGRKKLPYGKCFPYGSCINVVDAKYYR